MGTDSHAALHAVQKVTSKHKVGHMQVGKCENISISTETT
jgi:hypothetical protein